MRLFKALFLALILLTFVYGENWMLKINTNGAADDYDISKISKLTFSKSLDTMIVDQSGNTVDYELSEVEKMTFEKKDIPTAVSSKDDISVKSFKLRQNYPNPFNPTTTISFTVSKAVDVTVKIYDIIGRQIRTLEISKANVGLNEIKWDGKNSSGNFVSSGEYIFSVKIGNIVQSKKMILLK